MNLRQHSKPSQANKIRRTKHNSQSPRTKMTVTSSPSRNMIPKKKLKTKHSSKAISREGEIFLGQKSVLLETPNVY